MIEYLSVFLQLYWGKIHFILFGVILAVFLLSRCWREARVPFAGPAIRWFQVLAVCLIIAQVALYAAVPLYRDYAEPLMLVMALNWLNGGELYQSFSAGEGFVNSLYGPNVFLLNAAAVTLSGLPVSGKWLACGSAVLALGTIVATSLRQGTGPAVALAVVTLASALLAQFGWQWFWNRPEPFLLLATALAVPVLLMRPSAAAAVIVGLLAGFAANQKLHAPLYLVPVGLTLLYRADGRRLTIVLCGALSAVLAFAAPFLLPRVSLLAYAENLELASRHGLQASFFVWSLVTALGIIAPAVLLTASAGARTVPRDHLVLLGTFAAAMLVVAVVTAKPGSGATHMIPFVPIATFATGQAWLLHRERGRPQAVLSAAAAAAFAASTPIVAYTFYTIVKENHGWGVERSRNAELAAFARHYPDMEMASVQGQEPNRVNNRFQIGWAGQIVEYDEVTWGDLRYAGVRPEEIEVLFSDCRVAHWVIPRGTMPFAGSIFVDDLFSDPVRAAFRRSYRPIDRGEHYEVWGCATVRRPEASAQAPSPVPAGIRTIKPADRSDRM